MIPLTCAEVEEQMELYAADECDAPVRAAIAEHLAHCPACACSFEESRRLIGLLDLHWQRGDGLQRLHARIAEEARPRRAPRIIKRIWQPVRALAALLLVTVGLSWWLGGGLVPEQDVSRQLTLVLRPAALRVVPENNVAMRENIAPGAKDGSEKRTYTLDRGGRTTAVFRQQLQTAVKTADLPKPPEVNLTLEVRNHGDHPLHLWLGGRYSRLTMHLRGPDVVTIPVRHGAIPEFAQPKRITLAPGQSYFLPIPRLVYGSRGEVHYAYWTEPGEYTLTIQLRTLVCRGEKGVEHCTLSTITSPPLTIEVQSTP